MTPLGFLFTFGTYGSRLHGDARGSWQRGGSELRRNDMLRGYERSKLTQPVIDISPRMRQVIELALIEVCARRDWQLWAFNVRTQHVHLAAGATGDPQDALTAVKAYATRRLREEGLEPEGGKVWARGGSVGVLRSEEAVCRAVTYVLHRQGAPLAGSLDLSE